jgi:hypothetical protein
VAAVEALASSGALSRLTGICFTGFKTCGELSQALGLAALGMRVRVAVPLPLWGSGRVRDMLREGLAGAGGTLSHADHPASTEEIVDWFARPAGQEQG